MKFNIQIKRIPKGAHGKIGLFSCVSDFKGCLNLKKLANENGFDTWTELAKILEYNFGLDNEFTVIDMKIDELETSEIKIPPEIIRY